MHHAPGGSWRSSSYYMLASDCRKESVTDDVGRSRREAIRPRPQDVCAPDWRRWAVAASFTRWRGRRWNTAVSNIALPAIATICMSVCRCDLGGLSTIVAGRTLCLLGARSSRNRPAHHAFIAAVSVVHAGLARLPLACRFKAC